MSDQESKTVWLVALPWGGMNTIYAETEEEALAEAESDRAARIVRLEAQLEECRNYVFHAEYTSADMEVFQPFGGPALLHYHNPPIEETFWPDDMERPA